MDPCAWDVGGHSWWCQGSQGISQEEERVSLFGAAVITVEANMTGPALEKELVQVHGRA